MSTSTTATAALPINGTKHDTPKPSVEEENGEDPEAIAKAAAVAKQTALRSSLLPENALSARFLTTAGPNLKQVSGSVYVGSYPGEEQRVLWARTDEKTFPTGSVLALSYISWRNKSVSSNWQARDN